jgi:uncharacterized protein YcbK (DUF882 family)
MKYANAPRGSANTFWLPQDWDLSLSRNFRVGEFASRDGHDLALIHPLLVEGLQEMRDQLGRSITILSGYRSPEHNRRIGGAPHSTHVYGLAADIMSREVDLAALHRLAVDVGFGTAVIYPLRGFIHVDVWKPRAWET